MQSRSGQSLFAVVCLLLGATTAEAQPHDTGSPSAGPSAYAPPSRLPPPDNWARPIQVTDAAAPEPNYPQTNYEPSQYRLTAADEPAEQDLAPSRPLPEVEPAAPLAEPHVIPPVVTTSAPAAPAVADPPLAAQTLPASGAPLQLAPREKNHPSVTKPTEVSTAGTLTNVGASLGVVLGIFLVVVWFSRKYLPQSASPLPKDAVEVLGWAPLGGRQQMQLMRIGNKLILVAVTTGGAETLTEVTDALEVERLTALCRRTKPGSSTTAFHEALREFEREPAPGGFVGTTSASPSASAATARSTRGPSRLALLGGLVLTLAFAGAAQAQTSSTTTFAAPTTLTTSDGPATGLPAELAPPAPPADPITGLIAGGPEEWTSPQRLSSTLQIMLLLTVLSLAPAILLMTTSFVRIIVVLGLLKQALGTQQLPPSQVITALALFMTLLVMTPTWREVYSEGIQPYSEGKITSPEDAWKRASLPIKRFLSRQIELAGNSDDVWLFYDYLPDSKQESQTPETYDDVPMQALLPAFMLSELKTSFLIGFQIYLPFLILDIVVSSVTISMGMMMLPPVMISLPLKLLLFVLVDGWNLVVGMLMESFGAPL